MYSFADLLWCWIALASVLVIGVGLVTVATIGGLLVACFRDHVRRWHQYSTRRFLLFPLLVGLGSALPLGAEGGEPNGEPAWIEVPAVRALDDPRLGRLLSDIESHLPAGHQYRDQDLVTWAHETTHGINNRLAKLDGRLGAFYVLGNRGIIFRHPRVRHSSIRQFVAPEFRGMSFGLYLVQQSGSFEHQPLNVLDEWIAYTNGTEVALEHAMTRRPLPDQTATTEQMLDFCGYAAALLAAVKQADPGYAEFDELAGFVRWNVWRSISIAERARSYPTMFTSRSDELLAALYRRIGGG